MGPFVRAEAPVYSSFFSDTSGKLTVTERRAIRRALLVVILAAVALYVLTVAVLMDNWYVYVEDRYMDPEWGYEQIYTFGPMEGMYVDREFEGGEWMWQDIEPIRYGEELDLPIEGRFASVAYVTSALMWLGIMMAAIFLALATLSTMGVQWQWKRSYRVMAGHFGQLAFWFCIAAVLLFGIVFPNSFLNEIRDAENVYETASLGWTYIAVLSGCLVLWVAVAITSRAAGMRFVPFDGIIHRLSKGETSERPLADA